MMSDSPVELANQFYQEGKLDPLCELLTNLRGHICVVYPNGSKIKITQDMIISRELSIVTPYLQLWYPGGFQGRIILPNAGICFENVGENNG